jgi:hypothetical protein
VRVELDAVVLIYRAKKWDANTWKSVRQAVPLTWSKCHLGGRRPWFVCRCYSNGRYCGRRAAILLLRGRAICLPMVLRFGICEPTRDSPESQHKPRPKDQDAAGRHAKPV